MLPESFWVYKEKCVYKKNFICKEKSGAVKKIKKIKKHNHLYFGNLVLGSCC